VAAAGRALCHTCSGPGMMTGDSEPSAVVVRPPPPLLNTGKAPSAGGEPPSMLNPTVRILGVDDAPMFCPPVKSMLAARAPSALPCVQPMCPQGGRRVSHERYCGIRTRWFLSLSG